MIKTAFAAVFAVFALSAFSAAAELNALGRADVQELSANLELPEPQPVRNETATLTDNTGMAGLRELSGDEEAGEPLPALEGIVASKNGLDPVIITVPGLNFMEIGWGSAEFRNVLRFIKLFTPRKKFREADLSESPESFDPRYFFPEEYGIKADDQAMRVPNNYLETKLRELPGYAGRNVEVIPFTWSRDPGATRETVRQLQARITEVYDAYKVTGRPIYILAHSWGSVMSHTALHNIGRVRPDVRIEKFLTAGSPLAPSNFVVKLFLNIEALKSGLRRRVTKPSVVRTWYNFWARRDSFSNTIPAADRNFQADSSIENLEPKLISLILHNKALKKIASKDLFTIRNIQAWHGAYFFDYKASLLSINKEISVAFFQPIMAPQVMDCSQNPTPLCRN
ncbi:MAG: hypothetical protein Q7R35_15575 [Elusimicrobiota bacterium]|nr:hypothetical protein [Elusimicrobiota bacterium]